MKFRIVKNFRTDLYGFPVVINEVPMIPYRGGEIAYINHEELRKAIVTNLVGRRQPLSGNHIRFFRELLGLSLSAFGKLFRVSHACVSTWESSASEKSSMQWGTEFAMKYLVASKFFHHKEWALENLTEMLDKIKSAEFTGEQVKVDLPNPFCNSTDWDTASVKHGCSAGLHCNASGKAKHGSRKEYEKIWPTAPKGPEHPLFDAA